MHIEPAAGLREEVLPKLGVELADLGQESVVADGRLDHVHRHFTRERSRQFVGLRREIQPVSVHGGNEEFRAWTAPALP